MGHYSLSIHWKIVTLFPDVPGFGAIQMKITYKMDSHERARTANIHFGNNHTNFRIPSGKKTEWKSKESYTTSHLPFLNTLDPGTECGHMKNIWNVRRGIFRKGFYELDVTGMWNSIKHLESRIFLVTKGLWNAFWEFEHSKWAREQQACSELGKEY